MSKGTPQTFDLRPFFSMHALAAMESRGFSRAEVIATISDPEVSYEQSDRGAGRRVHQRGRVAVVLGSDLTVITVLRREVGQWT